MIMSINTIEEIASLEESKDIPYRGLVQTLMKIKAECIDEIRTVAPVKKSAQTLCNKTHITSLIFHPSAKRYTWILLHSILKL